MKIIIKLFFIILVIFGVWFFITIFSGNDREESQTFVVKNGEILDEISQNLYGDGLIKNKFVFRTWLWLKKAEEKVKAGSYIIPADASIREIAKMLINLPTNQQSTVQIIGGWNRQWDKLEKELTENNLSYQEFLQLTASKQDWQQQYSFLEDAPAKASLEGYLFPDTYFVDANTTVSDLVIKTLNNFDQKLDSELRQEIERQGKTIFEVVTLASIVEREAPNEEDKKIVADIFLKRLDINLALQSDATVNFVTGKGLAQPTLEDLQVDSLYNTYKYAGLPPGPISNPTLSSIEAVIYPVSNSYYFFLTTKEGEVIYSQTYDEHLANKAKYLD